MVCPYNFYFHEYILKKIHRLVSIENRCLPMDHVNAGFLNKKKYTEWESCLNPCQYYYGKKSA